MVIIKLLSHRPKYISKCLTDPSIIGNKLYIQPLPQVATVLLKKPMCTVVIVTDQVEAGNGFNDMAFLLKKADLATTTRECKSVNTLWCIRFC